MSRRRPSTRLRLEWETCNARRSSHECRMIGECHKARIGYDIETLDTMEFLEEAIKFVSS